MKAKLVSKEASYRSAKEEGEEIPDQQEDESEAKKESDWVSESSQAVEVINTSNYKSEVMFANDVQCLREPSLQEPSCE